ncbi:hypothetical protein ABK040_005609 [Willaertia magna]
MRGIGFMDLDFGELENDQPSFLKKRNLSNSSSSSSLSFNNFASPKSPSFSDDGNEDNKLIVNIPISKRMTTDVSLLTQSHALIEKYFKDEYASILIEKLNLSNSPKNINLVLELFPISKCKIKRITNKNNEVFLNFTPKTKYEKETKRFDLIASRMLDNELLKLKFEVANNEKENLINNNKEASSSDSSTSPTRKEESSPTIKASLSNDNNNKDSKSQPEKEPSYHENFVNDEGRLTVPSFENYKKYLYPYNIVKDRFLSDERKFELEKSIYELSQIDRQIETSENEQFKKEMERNYTGTTEHLNSYSHSNSNNSNSALSASNLAHHQVKHLEKKELSLLSLPSIRNIHSSNSSGNNHNQSTVSLSVPGEGSRFTSFSERVGSRRSLLSSRPSSRASDNESSRSYLKSRVNSARSGNSKIRNNGILAATDTHYLRQQYGNDITEHEMIDLLHEKELEKPPYLTVSEINELQVSFFDGFPFSLWEWLTERDIRKIKKLLTSANLSNFIKNFVDFCYYTFLQEYSRDSFDIHEIRAQFLKAYEELFDELNTNKTSRLKLTIHIPLVLLCIRVVSESVFRICFQGFWKTRYAEILVQKVSSMVSFLFDPEYDLLSKLSPIEANLKERKMIRRMNRLKKDEDNLTIKEKVTLLSPVMTSIVRNRKVNEFKGHASKKLEQFVLTVIDDKFRSDLLRIYMKKFNNFR